MMLIFMLAVLLVASLSVSHAEDNNNGSGLLMSGDDDICRMLMEESEFVPSSLHDMCSGFIVTSFTTLLMEDSPLPTLPLPSTISSASLDMISILQSTSLGMSISPTDVLYTEMSSTVFDSQLSSISAIEPSFVIIPSETSSLSDVLFSESLSITESILTTALNDTSAMIPTSTIAIDDLIDTSLFTDLMTEFLFPSPTIIFDSTSSIDMLTTTSDISSQPMLSESGTTTTFIAATSESSSFHDFILSTDGDFFFMSETPIISPFSSSISSSESSFMSLFISSASINAPSPPTTELFNGGSSAIDIESVSITTSSIDGSMILTTESPVSNSMLISSTEELQETPTMTGLPFPSMVFMEPMMTQTISPSREAFSSVTNTTDIHSMTTNEFLSPSTSSVDSSSFFLATDDQISSTADVSTELFIINSTSSQLFMTSSHTLPNASSVVNVTNLDATITSIPTGSPSSSLVVLPSLPERTMTVMISPFLPEETTVSSSLPKTTVSLSLPEETSVSPSLSKDTISNTIMSVSVSEFTTSGSLISPTPNESTSLFPQISSLSIFHNPSLVSEITQAMMFTTSLMITFPSPYVESSLSLIDSPSVIFSSVSSDMNSGLITATISTIAPSTSSFTSSLVESETRIIETVANSQSVLSSTSTSISTSFNLSTTSSTLNTLTSTNSSLLTLPTISSIIISSLLSDTTVGSNGSISSTVSPSISPLSIPTSSITTSPFIEPPFIPMSSTTISPSTSLLSIPTYSTTTSPFIEPPFIPMSSTTISPSTSLLSIPTYSTTTSPFIEPPFIPTSSTTTGPSTSPSSLPTSSITTSPFLSLVSIITSSTNPPSSIPTSSTTTSSFPSTSPIPNLIGEPLMAASVRMIIRITLLEHSNLKNETNQRDLEVAIVEAYVNALRDIGANRKRQTTSAQIIVIGSRNSATGDVPVDFYITASNTPIEGSLVVAVLTRNQPEQIGGYEVIHICVIGTGDCTVPPILSSPVIIAISVSGGVLLIAVACIILGVIMGIKWKRGKYQGDDDEVLDVGVEALSYHNTESVAIQHGTPTIEKLTRRSRQKSEKPISDRQRNSTIALLASSSSGQMDAWQNTNLTTPSEPPTLPSDETSAALFQRVSHFSEFQPMPSPRSFKLKFHSSSVAPSSSTQSKTSLDNPATIKVTAEVEHTAMDEEIPTTTAPHSPNKTKLKDRVKLHSRRATLTKISSKDSQQQESVVISNQKVDQRPDSEGDGGLGDVEPSSHSDGGEDNKKPVLPHHTSSRPSTKRRNARRKLTSRGNPSHVTTDGYDTTDHNVPPSRQSRKNRSSRSIRSRPSTHGHHVRATNNLARTVEHDTRRELAWMSTENGVQLISIQPMERVPPSPQVRPSWQALPQLPHMGGTTNNQTYSRDQLEQLLQIHQELERVEQGLQRGTTSGVGGGHIESSDSTMPMVSKAVHSSTRTKDSHKPVPGAGTTTILDSSSSISAELASQAFKSRHPSDIHPGGVAGSDSNSYQIHDKTAEQHWYTRQYGGPQMGQLLWTPGTANQQAHSQPIQTQPLSLYQLSQLRNPTSPSPALYPPTASPLYPPTAFPLPPPSGGIGHPFGAS